MYHKYVVVIREHADSAHSFHSCHPAIEIVFCGGMLLLLQMCPFAEQSTVNTFITSSYIGYNNAI